MVGQARVRVNHRGSGAHPVSPVPPPAPTPRHPAVPREPSPAPRRPPRCRASPRCRAKGWSWCRPTGTATRGSGRQREMAAGVRARAGLGAPVALAALWMLQELYAGATAGISRLLILETLYARRGRSNVGSGRGVFLGGGRRTCPRASASAHHHPIPPNGKTKAPGQMCDLPGGLKYCTSM